MRGADRSVDIINGGSGSDWLTPGGRSVSGYSPLSLRLMLTGKPFHGGWWTRTRRAWWHRSVECRCHGVNAVPLMYPLLPLRPVLASGQNSEPQLVRQRPDRNKEKKHLRIDLRSNLIKAIRSVGSFARSMSRVTQPLLPSASRQFLGIPSVDINHLRPEQPPRKIPLNPPSHGTEIKSSLLKRHHLMAHGRRRSMSLLHQQAFPPIRVQIGRSGWNNCKA
jgi:hypothetical protein